MSTQIISEKLPVARPQKNIFARLKRITTWLIIGMITLPVIDLVYQTIATQIDSRITVPNYNIGPEGAKHEITS